MDLVLFGLIFGLGFGISLDFVSICFNMHSSGCLYATDIVFFVTCRVFSGLLGYFEFWLTLDPDGRRRPVRQLARPPGGGARNFLRFSTSFPSISRVRFSVFDPKHLFFLSRMLGFWSQTLGVFG